MLRTLRNRPALGRGAVVLPALLLLVTTILAVVPAASSQTVDISGFIKSSYYYDTRQVVAAREGDFLLYPAAKDPANDDGTGDDLNDEGNLLFFPFFSRITFDIGDLPDALGAKVTGKLETDFFGAGNSTLNSVRMRRGYVKLDWTDYEALFGMDWSPTFIETWPRTVATEAGAPFQPFARYPQIRFTLKPEGFRVSGIVAQQRDAFAEISGLKTQQQSGLPMLMGFAEIVREDFLLGGGAWIKWVRPALGADNFNAKGFQGFVQYTPDTFAARAKVTYGEDLADMLMTGGYVVQDDGSFTPLNTLALWGDLETTGQPFGVGLFGGYFSNLGAGETVDVAAVSARNPEIEYAWRIAPRAIYNAGRVRFAFELQVTSAMYASGFDQEYKPMTADSDEAVTNVRGDFTVFLFF